MAATWAGRWSCFPLLAERFRCRPAEEFTAPGSVDKDPGLRLVVCFNPARNLLRPVVQPAGRRQERHAREGAQELGTGVLAVEAHREDRREDEEADAIEKLQQVQPRPHCDCGCPPRRATLRKRWRSPGSTLTSYRTMFMGLAAATSSPNSK